MSDHLEFLENMLEQINKELENCDITIKLTIPSYGEWNSTDLSIYIKCRCRERTKCDCYRVEGGYFSAPDYIVEDVENTELYELQDSFDDYCEEHNIGLDNRLQDEATYALVRRISELFSLYLTE